MRIALHFQTPSCCCTRGSFWAPLTDYWRTVICFSMHCVTGEHCLSVPSMMWENTQHIIHMAWFHRTATSNKKHTNSENENNSPKYFAVNNNWVADPDEVKTVVRAPVNNSALVRRLRYILCYSVSFLSNLLSQNLTWSNHAYTWTSAIEHFEILIMKGLKVLYFDLRSKQRTMLKTGWSFL